MSHVARIVDVPGRPGAGWPVGWYVNAYDPQRRPARERDVPSGASSSTHCLLVLTPLRDDAAAMRPADWLAALQADCRCGVTMPGGRPCRPLSAYTLGIEPA